jgi:predicted dehydrogenase
MTLRVGIVGTGFMARAHACALRLAPCLDERYRPMELTAVCGHEHSDPHDWEVGAFGGAQRETDLDALLERADVDAVFVATPDHLHVPMAAAAQAAGKFALCEKPLAPPGPVGVDALQAERFAIAFVYRFVPGMRLLHQLLHGDGDSLGRALHYDVRYRQDWRAREQRGWRKWPGSGALADVGIHAVDLVRWLSDGADFDVSDARFRQGQDGSDVAARVVLGADDAAAEVLVDQAWVEANSIQVDVRCERGVASFDNARPDEATVVTQGRDGPIVERHRAADRLWPAGHWSSWLHAVAGLQARVWDAVHDGAPPAPSLDDALAAHRLVTNGYELGG